MHRLESYLLKDKEWWYKSIFWRNVAARSTVIYFFGLEGMLMGVVSCYYADIQDKLGLSDATLGTAVLFIYLGCVLASPIAAFTLTTLGSKASTFLGGICYGVSLSTIPPSNSLGVLILTMFIFGLSMGVMDISMNSTAIMTEVIAQKPLFGSFHGSYSVAAAAGSLIGGALVGSSYGMTLVFAAWSVASVVLTTLTTMNNYNFAQEKRITDFKNHHHVRDSISEYAPLKLPPTDEEQQPSLSSAPIISPGPNSRKFFPNRSASPTSQQGHAIVYTPLLDNHEHSGSERSSEVSSTLRTEDEERSVTPNQYAAAKWEIAFYCMVGFLAAFGESSIVTWSILYFDRYIPGNGVIKSLGFTCFQVSMGLGRFSCDWVRRQIGRRRMIRGGGVLAFSGLTLAAMALNLPSSIAFACIGFSVTGFGLSTLIPTAYSSSGHIPGVHPGTAISIVSMFTNAGGIVSSPMVGVLSDAFGSLQWALLCDAVLLGLVFPVSWGIPDESVDFMQTHLAEGDGLDEDSRGDSKDIHIRSVVA